MPLADAFVALQQEAEAPDVKREAVDTPA